MNFKLLEFFTYHPIFPIKNFFFQFLSTALTKLTGNDKNKKKIIIIIIFTNKTSNNISNWLTIFLRYYTFLKVKKRVLIFSQFAWSFLKSSNLELQKSWTSQKILLLETSKVMFSTKLQCDLNIHLSSSLYNAVFTTTYPDFSLCTLYTLVGEFCISWVII